LLEKGLQVFLFDLDGHGKDNGTLLRFQSMDDCVERAFRTCEQLAFANGSSAIPQYYLVGHSLGGLLIMTAMARHRLSIAKAVVISTPTKLHLTMAAVGSELSTVFSPDFWRQKRYYNLTEMIPAFLFFKRDQYPIRLGESGFSSAQYIKLVASIVDRADLEQTARQISCPILYVYGSADFISPHTQGQALATNSPMGKFVLIRRANHVTTLFAKATVKQIIQWITDEA
jgi:pimeloyl-ACP methyl ester carboxylesterase